MKRLQFLSTLAVASTALVLGAATTAEIKEEPTAYTITETDKVFIVSGTMKEITVDCKGKSLYFKEKCNITFCRFTNVAHWVCEYHLDSRFYYNSATFIETDMESMF